MVLKIANGVDVVPGTMRGFPNVSSTTKSPEFDPSIGLSMNATKVFDRTKSSYKAGVESGKGLLKSSIFSVGAGLPCEFMR